jgi:uncharacterized membrane-anchored protein
MNRVADTTLSKVPEITLIFWIIKIAATTLGETAGDAVTMTLNLGYLIGTAIFAVLFVVGVAAQISAKRYHPLLYWAVIVATTTAGTTLADLFDSLAATLAIWYRTLGSVSVASVVTPKAEAFYWATIMFSQTLGTAFGDWMADTGLGYEGGALVFVVALAVVTGLYFFTAVSRTLLFWAAFILTRPLGATVGDLLDKPVADGGLALGRFSASAVLAVFIIGCILIFPQRAGRHPGETPTAS